MNRGPNNNRNASARADTPGRLGVHSPPSILIVAQGSDLRAFLRASLERWYQVAETPSTSEAVQHLEHCPPQALIVGAIDASEETAFVDALQNEDAPPVLKLWSSEPPGKWVDIPLRHPFMRIDLLRAVDRLLHSPDPRRRNGAASKTNDVEPEVTSQTEG